LVEEVGRILTPAPRMRIACQTVMGDLREGDSVAVNGCCLTAVALDGDSFHADLAPETLRRTSLGARNPGDAVNLERSLLATSRLGGHIVQGHVDGTAELLGLDELGDGNWWLRVRLPPGAERYVVHKGSIAIEGISLTVAAISGTLVQVTIIPHTYAHTSLRERQPGDRLNIELDVVAKYVEKLTAYMPQAEPSA
jgi:riboflavin synthase